MGRLCRFINVLSTVGSQMHLQAHGDSYSLVETGALRLVQTQRVADDAGCAAFLKLCDFVTAAPVRPSRVSLPGTASTSGVDFAKMFGCPVTCEGIQDVWTFGAADLDAPLTGAIPDVANSIDRIAEDYIASLEEGAIAQEVRQMIVQLLPSGHVDQDAIASKLHRSRSTLQRQLGSEGTSYRDIVETTREELAKKYLQDSEYTQAQIAFMVGFSDQSNFARAFKRWTGMSPGEFQKAA
jgi:AraC-like DNA-binding protein